MSSFQRSLIERFHFILESLVKSHNLGLVNLLRFECFNNIYGQEFIRAPICLTLRIARASSRGTSEAKFLLKLRRREDYPFHQVPTKVEKNGRLPLSSRRIMFLLLTHTLGYYMVLRLYGFIHQPSCCSVM